MHASELRRHGWRARIIGILIGIGGLLGAEAARAQSADFRCPRVGTELRFSTGGHVSSLGEVSPLTCRLKNLSSGQNFDRLLMIFGASSPVAKQNFAKISTLNPLQVGKSITYQYSGAANDGSSGTWTYTASIERFETASTTAGKYPSYLFLIVEQAFGGGARTEQRWWYSPEVGYAVKYEFKQTSGIPPKPFPANWQLIDLRTM